MVHLSPVPWLLRVMLGRSRLRRGVSLEVIVEEDDATDVTFDPAASRLDEDEDEDENEDEDDDSENAFSAPNSPGKSDGARGGGGGLGAQERQRRRERRKTVGLSRLRSVSCETLTLLDTSDMDSCWSEWDEEDDHHGGGHTATYVTLQYPISRRRILQTSSHCDSEDSGIEYHSNEDDQPFDEGQSSGGGHRIQEDPDSQSQSESTNTLSEDDDIHDQETATESDDDEEGGGRSRFVSRAEIRAAREKDKEQEELKNIEDKATKEEVEANVNISMQEEIEPQEEPTNMITTEETRSREEEENRKQLEEYKRQERGGGRDKRQKEGETGRSLQGYRAKEILENDKVVVVENSHHPASVSKLPHPQEAVKEVKEKRAPYTIRNKEVVEEELPRPYTVSSVRRLFEDPHTPLGHLTAWRHLGRFSDIKSNPSSKILKFDRSESTSDSSSHSRTCSFTLPRLLPSHHQRLPSLSKATPSSPATSPWTQTPRKNQMLTLFPSEVAGKYKQQQKKSQEQQKVKTQGGQIITLRKPTVRGFNVKKALQEDPRTFHAYNNTLHAPHAPSIRTPSTTGKQGNLQNGRRNHVHFAKHNTVISSEVSFTDRSDTESLASDISEDSGVSSSESQPHNHHYHQNNFSKDPNFMWIDPAVMAKIRSVGTTVIFFGPRRQAPSSRPSTIPSLRLSPSPPGPPRTPPHHHHQPGNLRTLGETSQERGPKSNPVPAPRIVGVTRKKQPMKTVPSDPRASTPNKNGGEGGHHGGRGGRGGDTSVVYDFTRSPAPSLCL